MTSNALPQPAPVRERGRRRPSISSRISWRDEQGQTTAEYGLVLLAAATIAMLVVAWAGGTGAITSFFDAIIEKITSLIA